MDCDAGSEELVIRCGSALHIQPHPAFLLRILDGFCYCAVIQDSNCLRGYAALVGA